MGATAHKDVSMTSAGNCPDVGGPQTVITWHNQAVDSDILTDLAHMTPRGD